MSTSEAAVDLTPSEQALLFADQFAPKGSVMKGKEPLLLGEGTVAVNPLAETLLSVALLALEKAGAVRLEHTTRKVLFGLMKSRAVDVQPTGKASGFPAGTLEARIERRLSGQPSHAVDVVYRFFDADMKWPHQFVLDVAKAGLGDRGLVTLEETKKMLVFTTVKATVTPERRAALQAVGSSAARALIQGAEGRGELWKTLQAQVTSGIARRTEAQDSGSNDFGSD
ncbi:MAG: hypothetical protein JWM27_2379 [Gemmatimonadetes bacterium]|nr:hypothetical protein [Gemmatimonadota bacterium]